MNPRGPEAQSRNEEKTTRLCVPGSSSSVETAHPADPLRSGELAGWACLALTTLAGLILFPSTADWDLYPLSWFGFAPLLYVMRHVRPRRAFLWGWWTGTVAI